MKKYSWIKQWVYLLAIVAGAATVHSFTDSVNPVTHKASIALYSQEQEIELGSKYYLALINEDGGVYNEDPKLKQLVEKVGKRLAKVSDRPDLPYQFIIVNNPTPNAWALPGGKIAINSGLLKLVDNESELAAVLSHEIVHAAARHRAEQWERSSFDIVFQILNSAAAPSHSIADYLLSTHRWTELKLTRDAELEADHYGIIYMTRAGYDLKGAITIQQKLAKHFGAEKVSLQRELTSTHPAFPNRVIANKALIQELSTKQISHK